MDLLHPCVENILVHLLKIQMDTEREKFKLYVRQLNKYMLLIICINKLYANKIRLGSNGNTMKD